MTTTTKPNPSPYPYEYRTQLAKQWLGSRYLLASEGKPMPAMIRRQAG